MVIEVFERVLMIDVMFELNVEGQLEFLLIRKILLIVNIKNSVILFLKMYLFWWFNSNIVIIIIKNVLYLLRIYS